MTWGSPVMGNQVALEVGGIICSKVGAPLRFLAASVAHVPHCSLRLDIYPSSLGHYHLQLLWNRLGVGALLWRRFALLLFLWRFVPSAAALCARCTMLLATLNNSWPHMLPQPIMHVLPRDLPRSSCPLVVRIAFTTHQEWVLFMAVQHPMGKSVGTSELRQTPHMLSDMLQIN